MTAGLKFWRNVVEPTFHALFEPLGKFLDNRRRRKSFLQPVVCGHRRDALRYYENGHYVVIEAELMFERDLDRLIHRFGPLKWDDSGKLLNDEETERVIQGLCEHFDRNGVRWRFADAAAN